jgi:4-hydroxy 2-oxovalerate aldolase
MTEILDCTLRDGGYYTNWDFNFKLVDAYIKTVSSLPINIVEPGYLSSSKDNKGPFYHLNKKTLEIFKERIRKNQKIFVMINVKEIKTYKCLINLIHPNINLIDGVRFAVDPYNFKKIVTLVKKAREEFRDLEYCFNLMYASKWIHDLEFVKKILKKSYLAADHVSLVDSYGAISPIEISKSLQDIKRTIKENFSGVHFHNNCNFALANTIISINEGIQRVDVTFTGIGRGSGNAETELLLAYLKKKFQSNFQLTGLLEQFNFLKNKMNWGPSYAYAYSARSGFSQEKMMNLIQNQRLEQEIAISAINELEISHDKIKIESNSKLAFYNLKKKKDSDIIVLGGGKTFLDKGPLIIKNLNKKKLLIVISNKTLEHLIEIFKIYQFNNEIFLVLTGNEINKINLNDKFLKKINIKYILLENKLLNKNLNFFKNKQIFNSNSIASNPLLVTGIFLKSLGFQNINLAFFDGGPESFLQAGMSETIKSIEYLRKIKMKIYSFTPTYLKVKLKNFWSNA